MIVILDISNGDALNFKTRKMAAEFIGCSLPTLRTWLAKPFYLHQTFIITKTDNEKVQRSNRKLLKKHMAKIRQEEIDRVNRLHIQGVLYPDRINGNSNPRSEQATAKMVST